MLGHARQNTVQWESMCGGDGITTLCTSFNNISVELATYGCSNHALT